MSLNYLDFDYSEDDEGTGTFDAMASVLPAQLAALHAEVALVLQWAHSEFPDACGPSEDGGQWQYDLQGVQDVSTPLALDFNAATGGIHSAPGTPAPAHHADPVSQRQHGFLRGTAQRVRYLMMVVCPAPHPSPNLRDGAPSAYTARGTCGSILMAGCRARCTDAQHTKDNPWTAHSRPSVPHLPPAAAQLHPHLWPDRGAQHELSAFSVYPSLWCFDDL